jgi:hypothetical protein
MRTPIQKLRFLRVDLNFQSKNVREWTPPNLWTDRKKMERKGGRG